MERLGKSAPRTRFGPHLPGEEGRAHTKDRRQWQRKKSTDKAARKARSCKRKYHIPLSMLTKEDVLFLYTILSDDTMALSTQLGHTIPHDHTGEQANDSCKRSGGGWSVGPCVWWHLVYLQEVLDWAMLSNNRSGKLISVNILEMVCVIITMVAAIFVCDHDNLNLSAFQVLLNECNTTSACT